MSIEHTHDAPDGQGPSHDLGPGYETRDANVPALLTFGVGLVVFIVVVQLLLLGIYRLLERERPEPVEVAQPENLYQQLRTLRGDEARTLGGYGWVDREAGVVRIPIDRAIDLVVERGDHFARGPKTEVEMNSHGGTPTPADAGKGEDKDKDTSKDEKP